MSFVTERLRRLGDILDRFFSAYGAFFILHGRIPNAFLLAATMVDAHTGMGGLLGLLGVDLARRIGAPARQDELDRINGLLTGLLIGATFWSWPLLLLAGGAASLTTAVLAPELEARGLPLLALPFALTGMAAWCTASGLSTVLAVPHPVTLSLAISGELSLYLQALGGVYLSPYPLSGALVLAALLWRSRYLGMLTVLGFATSEACLTLMGALRGGTTSVVAGTGAIVASILVAGLLTVPSLATLGMGGVSAAIAGLIYLALVGPLHTLGTPPLALPFILATWIVMRGFRGRCGAGWLLQAQLPEQSAEISNLALARGIDGVSVPLAPPFEGEWTIYQACDGPHTHQGLQRHALDFFKTFGGRSFRGEGLRLGDYYAYDQWVLSPAGGVVVGLCADLPDLPPGDADVRNCFGNHLLLDIGDGLCAVLAHLRRDSLLVGLGDRVQVGQRLAACGNSGRSPQPHLHLHLQRGKTLGLPTIPFHLAGVVQNDQFHLRRELQPGDGAENPARDHLLAEALKLPVGRRMVFCCEEPGKGGRLCTLTVILDPTGGFWLRDEVGAELAFHQSCAALTFFGRRGSSELLLDALALGLGVTPLVEAPCRWTDRPPLRLMTGHRASLYNPLGFSRYNRRRSSGEEWLQFGEHARAEGRKVLLTSRAVLHRELGVRELVLWRGETTLLRARLVALGMASDLGIPGWMENCVEPVAANPMGIPGPEPWAPRE